MRHHRKILGGLRIHWVEEGEGAPLILLHGFPEFWYAWRYQIPALAAAGFRVVAPDLRGYNGSDRPEGVGAYEVDRVVGDVVALARELGTPVHLAGHDWGGLVALRVAAQHPELIRKLVILNAPHPGALRRELRRPTQLLRSWYVLFFQLPGVPEWIFRAADYELVERVMRRDIRRHDVLHETDFRVYVEALSRPGALGAALNYYRAAFRSELARMVGRRRDDGPSGWKVACPTLVIWGLRDRYLGPGLLHGLDRWIPDLRVERIEEASHWVQVEAHEEVTRLMRGFLDLSDPPLPGESARPGEAPGE